MKIRPDVLFLVLVAFSLVAFQAFEAELKPEPTYKYQLTYRDGGVTMFEFFYTQMACFDRIVEHNQQFGFMHQRCSPFK